MARILGTILGVKDFSSPAQHNAGQRTEVQYSTRAARPPASHRHLQQPARSTPPESVIDEEDLEALRENRESQNYQSELRVQLAFLIDRTMKTEAPADWRGDEARERRVKNLLHKLLGKNKEATLEMFEFLKNRPDAE